MIVTRVAERKRKFRASMALAGLRGVREWADRYGYSREHVQDYLDGRHGSRPLTLIVDAFIAEQAA